MTTPTPPPLTGWQIAITGTSRGIGRALAEAAARAGAAVVAHARTEAEADAVAAALSVLPGAAPARGVAGDLRDPTLAARLAAAAAPAGGLDALVLSAGLLGPLERLVDTDFDAFRDVMAVNVDAQLRLFVAALPLLRARRGRVVWLTSGLGHFALPGYGVYCASKHAVEGLAKLAAVEHADDGIVSVAVAPGMVQTEMLAAALGGVADLSAYTAPAVAATAFVALLAALRPEHSGRVLDLGATL